jgi:hypothetical protein
MGGWPDFHGQLVPLWDAKRLDWVIFCLRCGVWVYARCRIYDSQVTLVPIWVGSPVYLLVHYVITKRHAAHTH